MKPPITLLITTGTVPSTQIKHNVEQMSALYQTASCLNKNPGSELKKEKKAILTCSLLKVMGAGGFPSPWQWIFTVSPSLTKPSGDSLHISTLVVGSKGHMHIHKDPGVMNLSLFIHGLPRQCYSYIMLYILSCLESKNKVKNFKTMS